MLNNKKFIMSYEYYKKLYDCPSCPHSIIRRESYTYNFWLLDKKNEWLKMEWEAEEFGEMMKSGRVVRIDQDGDEILSLLTMQELVSQPEEYNSSLASIWKFRLDRLFPKTEVSNDKT